MKNEQEMQPLKVKCPKCEYSWAPRVENPVKCPKCGHRLDARIFKIQQKKGG